MVRLPLMVTFDGIRYLLLCQPAATEQTLLWSRLIGRTDTIYYNDSHSTGNRGMTDFSIGWITTLSIGQYLIYGQQGFRVKITCYRKGCFESYSAPHQSRAILSSLSSQSARPSKKRLLQPLPRCLLAATRRVRLLPLVVSSEAGKCVLDQTSK